MKAIESTTYLTYSMTSSQNPLEVSSSPQTPSVANLTFVASCSQEVGECTIGRIQIALPVGDPDHMDPTDLTVIAPPPSAASVVSSDGTAWNVAAGTAPGSFEFTPQAGAVLIAAQSLTFIIAGVQVSPLVGTADITISEWGAPSTYTPPSPPHCPSGRATIAAAKFPTGFFAFDFAPSSPQINSGDTVTLTWSGSSNATYTIAYGDQQQPTGVANGTWTSPQLYSTTAFVLTASASVAGQTVSLSLNATVVVASPLVVSFFAVPSEIDYNETVTLTWRATDADGVYLVTGQTDRRTLPAVSDPENPQTLQPRYGSDITLQAFKNHDGSTVLSDTVVLSYTFNPIVWTRLDANPTTLDQQNPSTTVSWEVDHAVDVYLNGTQVNAQGSEVMSPTSPSSYTLTATRVDGSTEQGPTIDVGTVQVQVEGHSVSFLTSPLTLNVTVNFTAENATGGTISNASMTYSNHGINWGGYWQSSIGSATATRIDNSNTWQFEFTFVIDLAVSLLPNVGLQYDWEIDGFVPVSARGEIVMMRGSFEAWNGS
jgi:plastocyanin